MPQEWTKFVDAHFQQIWLLTLGWVIGSFTFKYFRHRSKGRFFDDPSAGALLYSENFASGRSLKSWRTRFGGASNCLKIMITADRLFVRPIFPFLILGPDIDLVHSIPLGSIESATPQRGAFQSALRIKFRSTDSTTSEIDIMSKKFAEFEATLSSLLELRNGKKE
ncbi:MAG TPA: hypothetical protein VG734_00415 [Lacunisphaera sp.]|nr:hypothetical protein [Lacunisphaera sp.]